MDNHKTLNYPGVLRAYNRIEEKGEIKNKVEILSTLSSLIDRVIQIDIECIRQQQELVARYLTISDDEVKELLVALDESEVVLYEGVKNEEALVIKRCYQGTASSKAIRTAYKQRMKEKL